MSGLFKKKWLPKSKDLNKRSKKTGNNYNYTKSSIKNYNLTNL